MESLKNSYEAVLEFIDKMEELVRFQEEIPVPSTINQTWISFLDYAQKIIRTDACGMFLVHEDSHEFELRNVWPADRKEIFRKEALLQIECGMFSWVINRRKTAIIPSLTSSREKTIVMLPLITARQTLGAVFVYTPISESSITLENLKLLTMLSKQCSLVIENWFLYEKSEKEHKSLLEARSQAARVEKLASIGRLTSGAFHEILNPLNIISSYIQFLLISGNPDTRLKKYLSKMKMESDRIAGIVRGMLRFCGSSRHTQGKSNVKDGIQKALSLAADRLKKVEIIKNIEPGLPLIYCNSDSLLEVFFDVIVNAGDAMPGGGLLKISAQTFSYRRSQVDFIEISFEDTGYGVADAHIDKLFDPFFSTKETGKSPGLGLSISYGIIRDLGGDIRVERCAGRGTIVTIKLPCECLNEVSS